MKLNHDKDTDSLDIKFSDKPSAAATPGVVLDYAEDGFLVGIDIDHARKKLSLERMKSSNFPIGQVTLVCPLSSKRP